MAITDLPLFQALKSKMQWHQTRQSVLAQNIANADTPGYLARDVKEYSFKDHIGRQSLNLSTETTASGHIRGSLGATNSAKIKEENSFEVTPSGNSVNLEEQMMQITENQMDFQAATTLYTKGLGLIRTALSKSV
ncbi:flagellar basal body rod protein FlgB [Stappia sp. BW2]|jgi:flagellar basal-body rod protein FlgB|uniref:flagellar basal body rod protein FlgB n=1 Tax=Stappia sp. BW2 TaxID=2592622 RepID=UPI0011DE8D78|nr:flagellar basal body rod protein FlgB [Stappia sp. BW2]TYC65051.1 flagellar basal body rod protein FlgB [Stappia sp. BW2]